MFVSEPVACLQLWHLFTRHVFLCVCFASSSCFWVSLVFAPLWVSCLSLSGYTGFGFLEDVSNPTPLPFSDLGVFFLLVCFRPLICISDHVWLMYLQDSEGFKDWTLLFSMFLDLTEQHWYNIDAKYSELLFWRISFEFRISVTKPFQAFPVQTWMSASVPSPLPTHF